MSRKVYPKVFKFRGGQLALDFANTVHWHATAAPVELINSYADLLTWAQQAGVLTTAVAARLRRLAAAQPRAAERVRRTALALREAAYRLLAAQAHGRRAAPEDLTALNRAVAAALPALRLEPTADGYSWAWRAEPPALDTVWWPIARAAADLLTSEQLGRVGQCADERGCGWLFLDQSKNHRRRWCAMSDCGSLHKARRHYQRRRAAA